jgi:hypothetical protein
LPFNTPAASDRNTLYGVLAKRTGIAAVHDDDVFELIVATMRARFALANSTES